MIGVIIRRCALVLLLAAASLPMQGCATAYSATALEARLVDATTGQPVAGANVVAHWVLRYGYIAPSYTDLQLMETVTDAEGRFRFPGWGPTPVPADLPANAQLDTQDPELGFFKSGYMPRFVSSEIKGPPGNKYPLVRSSEWNGKDIALKTADFRDPEYAQRLSGFLTALGWGGCGWKRIPRTFLALQREARRLAENGIKHSIPSMRRIENTSAGRCGDIAEFFRAYDQ